MYGTNKKLRADQIETLIAKPVLLLLTVTVPNGGYDKSTSKSTKF
jgi:hypothetical protein